MIPGILLSVLTANTLTSRLIGEGKQNEVMPTVFKTIGQGLIAILPATLMLFVILIRCCLIYTDDLVLADASYSFFAGYLLCFDRFMSFEFHCSSRIEGVNTTNALILESVVLIAYTFSVWLLPHIHPRRMGMDQ